METGTAYQAASGNGHDNDFDEIVGTTECRESPVTLSDLKDFVATAHEALTLASSINWLEAESQVKGILAQAEKATGLQAVMKRLASQRIEERLAIVQGYDLDGLANTMQDAATLVGDLLRAKSLSQSQLRAAQADLEGVKAEILLGGSIDGKNAETRQAQLTAALSDHPAAKTVEQIRVELDNIDASMEVQRMAYATAKARLSAATAAMGLLGS